MLFMTFLLLITINRLEHEKVFPFLLKIYFSWTIRISAIVKKSEIIVAGIFIKLLNNTIVCVLFSVLLFYILTWSFRLKINRLVRSLDFFFIFHTWMAFQGHRYTCIYNATEAGDKCICNINNKSVVEKELSS